MSTTIINGTAGGNHVVDGPLTTSITREASPSLLLNEIDQRVARVRPYATPIDQISRCAGSRSCGSMIVDYYSVDTKPTHAGLKEPLTADSKVIDGEHLVYTIFTDRDSAFEPSETILVPGYSGYEGSEQKGALMLYVVSRANPGLRVIAVNGQPSQSNPGKLEIPAMPRGTQIVRMGRAAAELDVQTPQFNALPVKNTNFCQIFKAQIEESTLQKISNKEVGWTFSDQEEVAIMDMRMGMERNFLFGAKGRFIDPEKQEEVFVTGGIWNQAGGEYHYDADMRDSEFIVGITRAAFTGNSGSPRKILIAGSGLVEHINSLEYQKCIASDDKETRWGIDFRTLNSKFGTLYVIHSEVFDSCNREDDGIIIDPQYLTKYSHIPFRTERLDLKKSGQRNTNAEVITEASCLVLRHPGAHLRVIKD